MILPYDEVDVLALGIEYKLLELALSVRLSKLALSTPGLAAIARKVVFGFS